MTSSRAILTYSTSDCTGDSTSQSVDNDAGCVAFGASGALLYTCNYTEIDDDDYVTEDQPCFMEHSSDTCSEGDGQGDCGCQPLPGMLSVTYI